MEKPDNDEMIKDMMIDAMIDKTEMCKSCGNRMQHIDGNWICKECGFVA